MRPIPSCSMQVDSVVGAYPECLQAVTAAAKLVEASANLISGHDVYLQIPHAVQSSKLSVNSISFLKQTHYL